MTRVAQPEGSRGSLRWIQRAVNERWPSLDEPISAATGSSKIEWRSPLRADEFAEYRDGDFLDVVGLERLRPRLREFWPRGGPQWDALAVGMRGETILVEAKAHVGELCSPPTGASEASRKLISASLDDCAERLGARKSHAPWTSHFYQLANRLAHLQFLRDQGVPAYLVLVNFLNDHDMAGPSTVEAWNAAYQVAFHVLGLGKRHPMSHHVLHVYPDVRGTRSLGRPTS